MVEGDVKVDHELHKVVARADYLEKDAYVGDRHLKEKRKLD